MSSSEGIGPLRSLQATPALEDHEGVSHDTITCDSLGTGRASKPRSLFPLDTQQCLFPTPPLSTATTASGNDSCMDTSEADTPVSDASSANAEIRFFAEGRSLPSSRELAIRLPLQTSFLAVQDAMSPTLATLSQRFEASAHLSPAPTSKQRQRCLQSPFPTPARHLTFTPAKEMTSQENPGQTNTPGYSPFVIMKPMRMSRDTDSESGSRRSSSGQAPLPSPLSLERAFGSVTPRASVPGTPSGAFRLFSPPRAVTTTAADSRVKSFDFSNLSPLVDQPDSPNTSPPRLEGHNKKGSIKRKAEMPSCELRRSSLCVESDELSPLPPRPHSTPPSEYSGTSPPVILRPGVESDHHIKHDGAKRQKMMRTRRSHSISVQSSAVSVSQPHPVLVRTLSDPLQSVDEEEAAAAMLCSSLYVPLLPVVDQPGAVKRISTETMRQLLVGNFEGTVDHFLVIDCRYDYEYQGGHIPGAFNFNSREKIQKFYDTNKDVSKKVVIIFHCEFSKNRGPKACEYFRQMDRDYNRARYPRLTFPELYVLDGGYKKFHETHPTYCDPRGYISMWDPAYAEECKARTHAHRRSWEKSRRRSRQHRQYRRRGAQSKVFA